MPNEIERLWVNLNDKVLEPITFAKAAICVSEAQVIRGDERRGIPHK
jgi:hypothetical protein